MISDKRLSEMTLTILSLRDLDETSNINTNISKSVTIFLVLQNTFLSQFTKSFISSTRRNLLYI